MISLPVGTQLPHPLVLYRPHKKGNGDFFDQMDLSSRDKQSLREAISLIQITHQVDSRTTNVPAGKRVEQLMVIRITLTGTAFPKDLLDILDVRLGLYTIFVLENNQGQESLLVNYKEPLALPTKGKNFRILRSFETRDDFGLELAGADLDQVYASLVREVGKDQLVSSSQPDLKEAIQRTDQRDKLEKKAQQIKKKMYAEKSMRKQMELKKVYKELMQEIKKMS